MATFKPDEIKYTSIQKKILSNITSVIQNGGNEIARKKWRARWSPSSFHEPESGDVGRIREFIKLTYIEKKWLETAPSRASLPPAVTSPTIKKEPSKSLIDFDFDMPVSNPVPTSNPFANPFQVENSGFNAMFSSMNNLRMIC
jgi:hypothetical protein